MKLERLLEQLSYECIQGSTDTEVSSIVYDTRKEISTGACFICIKGVVFDGHEYAKTAVEQGASVIIAEHKLELSGEVTLIVVKNTREALSYVSMAYFDYPARKMKVVGITGTKGKTSTACMIYSALCQAGVKAGLIGSIENRIGEESITATHSTPESYLVQEYFAKMVACGTKCVVMEVSSQGLKLDRVAGILYDIGVFTNLGQDHIAPGEHPDFEDYLQCKAKLFRQCKVGIANVDDAHFPDMFEQASCKVRTFGLSEGAELTAKNIDLYRENGAVGVAFDACGCMNFHAKVNMTGRFNVYNAMAAMLVCNELGISENVIREMLEHVTVRGRVEPVRVSERFSVLLDYAHNAMSLQSLLTTLREYQPKRLICMFGCGGNRSKDRRFEMGEISSKLADFTVVTSDNPRFEEPEDIIADILTGVKKASGKYVAITDRHEAIKYCLSNAEDGDLIVIAGKGHEDYQEIRGVKYAMDDRKMILEAADEIKRSKGNL